MMISQQRPRRRLAVVQQTHFFLLSLLLLTLTTTVDAFWWMFDKVGLHCTGEAENEPNVECMAGGLFNLGGLFSGTYMCREQRNWIFWSRNETICVPTFADGIIGEIGDRCGCCDGDCPQVCTCQCNNDENHHVWVYKDKLLGSEDVECVSQGKASRWTASEHRGYTCVPEEECHLYTLEPTTHPTGEPTESPTTEEPTIAAAENDSDVAMMEVDTLPSNVPTFSPTDLPSEAPTSKWGGRQDGKQKQKGSARTSTNNNNNNNDNYWEGFVPGRDGP